MGPFWGSRVFLVGPGTVGNWELRMTCRLCLGGSNLSYQCLVGMHCTVCMYCTVQYRPSGLLIQSRSTSIEMMLDAKRTESGSGTAARGTENQFPTLSTASFDGLCAACMQRSMRLLCLHGSRDQPCMNRRRDKVLDLAMPRHLCDLDLQSRNGSEFQHLSTCIYIYDFPSIENHTVMDHISYFFFPSFFCLSEGTRNAFQSTEDDMLFIYSFCVLTYLPPTQEKGEIHPSIPLSRLGSLFLPFPTQQKLEACPIQFETGFPIPKIKKIKNVKRVLIPGGGRRGYLFFCAREKSCR